MVFRLARRVSLATGAFAFAVVLPGVALAGQPVFGIASQGFVVAAQSTVPSSVEQLQLTDQQRQKAQ
ncbi:MAG: hypothetical protein KME45_11700 [Stenomitos rutilans HA7619-LM2]|jgi:hypothetical protein|nr:hypothetical protein [Stenomitos rutilans HA7619-LM2]